MAVDFQIVFPQEVVKLGQIRPLVGLPVRTLDLYGEDFRSVEEVLINEIESPYFEVLSQHRMLVQVPAALSEANIQSVLVLSRRITITPRSLMRFRIGSSSSKVQGLMRLVQLYLKVLFTTPGTDIFDKQLGGGILRSIGKTIGRKDGRDLVSEFIVGADNTTRQIIQIQGRQPSTPPSERLLTATVLSAGFNPSETAVVGTIEVVSQARQSAHAQLEL